MALSEKDRRRIELDARLDSKAGVIRKYKGEELVHLAVAPIDLLSSGQKAGDHAREKQQYYDACRKALNDR